MTLFNAFSIESIVPLNGRDYYHYIMHAIYSATSRVWISMFIVDTNRGHDPDLEVRELLKLLAYKSWMGIDVRIIIGDSPDNLDIKGMNAIARHFLQQKGINARRYQGPKKSTHNKFLIIDDNSVIIGSHNWTANAFSRSVEDSIAIQSSGLVAELSKKFLTSWAMSGSVL